jgi:hypothetical protein
MAKRKVTKRELSKAEKFYVESNCKKISLEEICDDLECKEDVVSAFYNECLDDLKNKDTIDKLMIVNSKAGYAVMSKEASSKGESTKRPSNNKHLSEHIHKIR